MGNVFRLATRTAITGLAIAALLVAQLSLADKHAIEGKKKGKKKDKLEVNGLLMIDADYYGEFYDNNADSSNFETEVRRARAVLRYRASKDWRAKLQINIDDEDNDVDLGDAWISYRGWKPADITIGKMKEPLGLERMSGSASLATIERSLATEALTPGRSTGVQLSSMRAKSHTWAAGIFQPDSIGNSNDSRASDPVALTARGTWAPFYKKQKNKQNREKSTILHLGLAGSWRNYDEGRFRIREDGEVNTANNIIRSAEFQADQGYVAGLEAAFQMRGLLLTGEYLYTDIEQEIDGDWQYDAFYVQASYLFGGASRRYRGGEFRAPKTRKNSALWEIVARYSELNARDNNLGADASSTMLGLNYYLGKNVKLMANILIPDIAGNTVSDNQDGEAVSLRAQFHF